MAETSRDLQREVRELREDVDRVFGEMDHRLAEATDLKKQAKRHPYAFMGAGAAALGGLALLTYSVWMRSHGPGGGVWPLSAPRTRPMAEQLGEKMRQMRNDHEMAEFRRVLPRSEGPVKRLLWAVLISGMLTLATFLARKLTESAWTKTLGESPPAH